MPRRTTYGPGSPCWVDCVTPDPAAAQTCYAGLLDWTFQAERTGYALITRDGEVVGGFGASPVGQAVGRWQVYLATKDADASAQQLKELGGTVVAGPFPTGRTGRIVLAVDRYRDRAAAPVLGSDLVLVNVMSEQVGDLHLAAVDRAVLRVGHVHREVHRVTEGEQRAVGRLAERHRRCGVADGDLHVRRAG